MKKAKMLLAGIACFAVIGGAFAFKSARQARFLYVPEVAGGACTFKSLGITLLKPSGNPTTYSGFASTTTNATCPVVDYFTTI